MVRRNVRVCGWIQFNKCSRSTSPPQTISIYNATDGPTIIIGFLLIMR